MCLCIYTYMYTYIYIYINIYNWVKPGDSVRCDLLTWACRDGDWIRNLTGYSYAAFPGRSAFQAESRALSAATDIVRRLSAYWEAHK